jgi:hypothetical protein
LLQAPQLFVSELVSTHLPLQAVVPVGQLPRQAGALGIRNFPTVMNSVPHTWVVAQQVLLHGYPPPGQVMQTPPEQVC